MRLNAAALNAGTLNGNTGLPVITAILNLIQASGTVVSNGLVLVNSALNKAQDAFSHAAATALVYVAGNASNAQSEFTILSDAGVTVTGTAGVSSVAEWMVGAGLVEVAAAVPAEQDPDWVTASMRTGIRKHLGDSAVTHHVGTEGLVPHAGSKSLTVH